MHRDDFAVLTLFNTPKNMLENTMISHKCSNILKTHCIDTANKGCVQLLVKIKEIWTKTVFLCASQTLGPLLSHLHTTYRHLSWPKFSPPQDIQMINYRFSHSLNTPLECRIDFECYLNTCTLTDVHTHMTTFTCPLPVLYTPTPKTVPKWLEMAKILGKCMVPLYIEGHFPPSDGNTFSIDK